MKKLLEVCAEIKSAPGKNMTLGVSSMEQRDIDPPKSENIFGDSHPWNDMIEARILGSLFLDYS